jgi:predicted DNA-binding ribbon-helix-helix protein
MTKRHLETRILEVVGPPIKVSLEPAMWAALDEILLRQARNLPKRDILYNMTYGPPNTRSAAPPASALRAAILNYFRAAATKEGHKEASHGNVGNRFEENFVRSDAILVASLDDGVADQRARKDTAKPSRSGRTRATQQVHSSNP